MNSMKNTTIAAQHRTLRRTLVNGVAGLLACTALTAPAFAEDAADAPEPEKEIVVTGSLNALPVKDVGSVFGFDKNLVDTPRSASSISKEQMERFGITEIYDLVSQSPGTFTNSFFGVGGALDIRGTPGEVYFRGVRRLDNPGNYPTPIGASDRIDIVRGPSSPIFGPSKTGGYMNFVPKSARVASGKYMDAPAGQLTFTGGSWDKAVLSAELRGPGKLGSQEFGYSLYAEVEDSGSYYRNMSTKQTILQGSFDTDLSPNLRLEFGGMYQNYKGQQNGGWNRLTQALVDNGTYITGDAQPLDTNGDGKLAPSEFQAGGRSFGVFGTFACTTPGVGPLGWTDACLKANYPYLALTNVGTAKLSRRDTLTGVNDKLWNKSTTAYMDLIWDGGNDLEIKNQLFYDAYDNLNENAYGFSQFHNSYVIENKIVLTKKFTSDLGKFAIQLSPSVRYTDFLHGDDFSFEYFHRVDLTKGYDARSTRLLSTQSGKQYDAYLKGYYTDWGFAGLTNLDFNFGLDVTLGARYDSITGKSSSDASRTLSANGASVKATKGAWSWSASANYRLPFGLVPYGTISRQSVVIAGQGAELDPSNLTGGTWISASNLYEGGIKGSFLDNRLYAAVSIYKQSRVDYNAQSITVNQAVETKGLEAELRWSVDRHFLVTSAYTRTKVYNLTGINDGSLFSFFGVGDLKNVTDPSLYFGGQLFGLVFVPTKDKSLRAGIPSDLFSATATYSFDNGIAVAGSVSHVPSVYSGQSQSIKLPAYTLVDGSVTYSTGPWLFRAVVKNLTNAKYFRANFTELFGSTIALPERPRSWQASVVYKF